VAKGISLFFDFTKKREKNKTKKSDLNRKKIVFAINSDIEDSF